jgi:FAD/FMN-containing dehydrogenase
VQVELSPTPASGRPTPCVLDEDEHPATKANTTTCASDLAKYMIASLFSKYTQPRQTRVAQRRWGWRSRPLGVREHAFRGTAKDRGPRPKAEAPTAHAAWLQCTLPNCAPLRRTFAERTSERLGVRCITYGHAGDGNYHVNFLWNDPDHRPRVERAIDQLFRNAVELGGTLSGEHGIGLLKAPYLGLAQSPELIRLQRELKRVFDPDGLLNPGKIFPAERVSIMEG